MRFLMIGISIVIGIILVGVVFSVTTDLTQPRDVEKVVSFEILTDDGVEGTVTDGTYDEFKQYYEQYSNQFPLVIKDIIINNVSIGNPLDGYIMVDSGDGYFYIYEFNIVDGNVMFIKDDDTFITEDYSFTTNDIVEIVFLIEEPQITSTSAILIALVPILFATGVILYAYNNSLRGREE